MPNGTYLKNKVVVLKAHDGGVVIFIESSLFVCMFLKRFPTTLTNSASLRSGLLWLRAISHKFSFVLPGLSCRLLVLPPGAAGPGDSPVAGQAPWPPLQPFSRELAACQGKGEGKGGRGSGE